MSRYCGNDRSDEILAVATKWRDAALLRDGSVFGEGALWTLENTAELDRLFVKNLDEGPGNYIEKLKRQLAPAGQEVKQLAAEVNWLMLLCPSNITPESKRRQIDSIWSWSWAPLPDSAAAYLSDSVLSGIGSAGAGFNNHRWREFSFAINFLDAFKRLDAPGRSLILRDSWQFAEWLEGVPDARARQLRHMILYLLFPDDFERIFSQGDRRAIAVALSGLSTQAINAQRPYELDRTLRRLRSELETKYGTTELDYYVPPLRAQWLPVDFAEATRDITAVHVHEALAEIDKTGVPEGAESTGYDLVFEGKRYPPKLVLSLAAKAASGTEFDRSLFSGGEESPAFRLLRKLGFTIERKSVLPELLRRFLAQAASASDLTVRDYPSEYRNLRVSVSFGKDNVARVPWISFLGPNQQTQKGIYPVVLYYREAGWLIVAYGVSETEPPDTEWPNVPGTVSIREFFVKQAGREPERYGDSLVAHAFQAVPGLDLTAVARTIDQTIDQYSPVIGVAAAPEPRTEAATEELYTLEDAVEGLFIELPVFGQIVARLRDKKNVILQGPPGVGKTYIARRIAYALMGRAAKARVRMVQFHASYSYEDFVQGYRPSAQGFGLKNGVFYDFCTAALADDDHDYVFIVDEINRGNLSKIFGELMMLIEADKRNKDWEVPLTYAPDGQQKFFIPPNVYLIGLMNTADRSIAMVDYALRRRFSFVDLMPAFESKLFQEFLRTDCGAPEELILRIVRDMKLLNDEISKDTTNLGPGFCIGHSYFCPRSAASKVTLEWYRSVVSSEIVPLLREYWSDNNDKAIEWERRLLSD